MKGTSPESDLPGGAPPIYYADPTDSSALVELYDSTNGDGWFNKGNWLIERVQTWYGITINSSGKIIYINLSANGLSGTIPSEIGDLTSLQIMNLFGNQLSGEIPVSIGYLVTLTYIDLHNNLLTGAVPHSRQANVYINHIFR